LSIKLKQRASVLAVGVALSAATLALSPGVAQATGTDTVGECVCGLIGEITDTSGGNTGGPVETVVLATALPSSRITT
jgi:hypothetical protein